MQSALARWVQLAPEPQWERKGLQLNPEGEALSRQRSGGGREDPPAGRKQTVKSSEGVLMDKGPRNLLEPGGISVLGLDRGHQRGVIRSTARLSVTHFSVCLNWFTIEINVSFRDNHYL